MNLAPYIHTLLEFIETYWLSLLLGLSGWFLISCVCFWWGAMVKRAEPKIIHGVHRFRLDEHSNESVDQERDSTSRHSTKAEGEPDEEAYPGLVDDGKHQ